MTPSCPADSRVSEPPQSTDQSPTTPPRENTIPLLESVPVIDAKAKRDGDKNLRTEPSRHRLLVQYATVLSTHYKTSRAIRRHCKTSRASMLGNEIRRSISINYGVVISMQKNTPHLSERNLQMLYAIGRYKFLTSYKIWREFYPTSTYESATQRLTSLHKYGFLSREFAYPKAVKNPGQRPTAIYYFTERNRQTLRAHLTTQGKADQYAAIPGEGVCY